MGHRVKRDERSGETSETGIIEVRSQTTVYSLQMVQSIEYRTAEQETAE
jgi:hypothetical protein